MRSDAMTVHASWKNKITSIDAILSLLWYGFSCFVPGKIPAPFIMHELVKMTHLQGKKRQKLVTHVNEFMSQFEG
jgi:hypothetical protein